MRPRVAGMSPMAARSSVVLPAPFGPIRTVGAPGAEGERNIVEDRHLAGEDRDFYEHYRQVGGGCAHGHPA